jgi:hypothetical protein
MQRKEPTATIPALLGTMSPHGSEDIGLLDLFAAQAAYRTRRWSFPISTNVNR